MPTRAEPARLLSKKLDLVFSTFIEATGLITTGASLSRIVTPILSCACEILSGRMGLAILEHDGSATRILYSHRPGSGHIPIKEEEVSLAGVAARLRRVVGTGVVARPRSPGDVWSVAGLGDQTAEGTVVAGGLRYRDQSLGVLGVLCPKARPSQKQDIGLFGLLVRQAGVAIKNAREFEKTQTLSITDGLTGAYNYRFLIDALRKEIGVAERYREVFSLVMIDVDGLKEYNDIHGHLGGSEVIRQVARVASSRMRSVDMLCKYGGDEFVALLPRTPKKGAAVAAERLRQAVHGHRFPGEETSGKITASFGIASYPEDGTTVEGLLSSADKALYKAKRHGRNKVWISGRRRPYLTG